MPGGRATARLFDQSLVMIDAYVVYPQQVGGYLGQSPGQHEFPHSFIDPPEIHDLQKGLPISVPLRQSAFFRAVPCRRTHDQRTIDRDLDRTQQLAGQDAARSFLNSPVSGFPVISTPLVVKIGRPFDRRNRLFHRCDHDRFIFYYVRSTLAPVQKKMRELANYWGILPLSK